MRTKALIKQQTSAFHVGQLIGDRDEQEDSYGIFYRTDDAEARPLGFMVADGMGGHVGGAIASQTVVDSAKLCLEDSDEVLEETLLGEIVEACTDNVAQCVRLNPEFEGMGSTLALIIFHGPLLSLLSIGDSLIYGFSAKQGLRRLNEDHSMKPVLDRLINAGELSLTEKEYDSQKNMLRSAITGSKVELVDFQWQTLRVTDYEYLILASDGIDVLGIPKIERMIANASKDSPARVVDEITRSITCVGAKGQDNVTIIAIAPAELLADANDA